MEILLRAEESSDLGEAPDGQLGDVDVLRAAGMAGQDHDLAIQLWRLTILGEKRSFINVVNAMADLAGRMGISQPLLAVCEVLGWMMQPTCKHCHGRGLMPIAGVEHVLSDDVCPQCGGSGHRPKEFGDGAKTLYAAVENMQSYAASAIARKLRG